MGGDPGKPSVGHQWETLIYFLPFVLLSFVHFFLSLFLKNNNKTNSDGSLLFFWLRDNREPKRRECPAVTGFFAVRSHRIFAN